MRGTVCKRIRRRAIDFADPKIRGEAEVIYNEQKGLYNSKRYGLGAKPKLKTSRRQKRLAA